ncbi:hypothetical protein [Flavobacterium sp.]|uniref:hypothetical protein n=1 Tax=Flavobacterium sp. TaxID=239 RepID=UPI003D0E35AC
MKRVFFILMFGAALNINAQEKKNQELKADELPAVVIKKAGEDFSVYLPDRNPDNRVLQMQEKFIGYDLGSVNGEEEYLVMFDAKDATLVATYNEKGKLTRVVEKYENVQLPRPVIYSVYKSYPDWTIIKDKFLYTQSDGNVEKKQYNLKIKNGEKTKHIIVSPNGEMLAGL